MKENVMDILGLLDGESGHGGLGQILYVLAIIFVAALILFVLLKLV